jgi:hypothetical protein
MRLKVEYYDQNEAFAQYLPRAGSTTGPFVADDGTPGWCLLELDEPFEFQVKEDEPFRFRQILVTHLLLRSRWVGSEIGGDNPTSVFILLVDQGPAPFQEPFAIKDYVHIAWGMCARDSGGV